jgi:hypothetical protein
MRYTQRMQRVAIVGCGETTIGRGVADAIGSGARTPPAGVHLCHG